MKKAKIIIKDIAIDCILGVSQEERIKKQTIFVSLELLVDATKASKTDDIADTVNYFTLYEKIIAMVLSSQFHLLEALVSAILAICLKEKGVLEATVRVEKPHVLPKAKGVVLEVKGKNIK